MTNTKLLNDTNDYARRQYINVCGLKLRLASVQVEYLLSSGYDIEQLIIDGFKYDRELTETLKEQIETFSESAICANNDY